MKKVVSLLLISVMICLMCACGSSKPQEKDVPAEKVTEDVVEKSETKEIEPNVENNVKKESPSEPETQAKRDGKIDFPKTTIVDNELICVEVSSIEWDSIWGYRINFVCENKTDKNLMFSTDYSYVNGWDFSSLFASTIAAGKKSNETLDISFDTLEACKIDDVTNVTFGLHVYDSDDWFADAIERNEYTIYPLGEEADKEYEREPQSGDEILADNDDVSIIVVSKGIDSIWGYRLTVYLENKTDKNLMISTDDASVNGFMCDPFWAKSLNSHKKAISYIDWGKYTLEEQELTPEDIEEIELPICVSDDDDIFADNILEETYTIKAK